jgi:hypothetical protein
MVSHRTAAVPGRDDRGRGCACAKVVGVRTSRGVGTNVTVKTRNVGGWCGAGRRRGGRRDDARTMPPKPSTPRRNGRAVSAPLLRRKHRRTPRLWRRVVTQQKFCCRWSCVTGRGAMNLPCGRWSNGHAAVALPATRRCAGCWIGNVSGGGVARSKAAAPACASTLPHVHAAADRTTTPSRRCHHHRRRREPVPPRRRSAVAGLRRPAC